MGVVEVGMLVVEVGMLVVVVEAGSLLVCPSMSEAALMSRMQGKEAVMVSAWDR